MLVTSVLEDPFCRHTSVPLLEEPAVVSHYLVLLPSVFAAFIALTLPALQPLVLLVVQFPGSLPLPWEGWGVGLRMFSGLASPSRLGICLNGWAQPTFHRLVVFLGLFQESRVRQLS